MGNNFLMNLQNRDEELSKYRKNEFKRIKDTQRMCPLITENPNRFVVLPINFQKTWDLYKEMQASVWMVKDYNFDLFIDCYQSQCNVLEMKYIASMLHRVADFDTATVNCILLEILQYPEARSIYGWTASQDYQIQELATLILKDIVNDDNFKENKLMDESKINDTNSTLVYLNWQEHVMNESAVIAERFLCHVILKFGILLNFCLMRAITLGERDIIFKKLIETLINDMKMSLMIFTSLKDTFVSDESFLRYLVSKLLLSEFEWIHKTSDIQIKHQEDLINNFIKFVSSSGVHTLDVRFFYDGQSVSGFSVTLHNIGVEHQKVPKQIETSFISFDEESF